MNCEGLEKVIIGDDLERFFQVGARLPPQEKEELVELLRRNVDVFAWDAYEAPGLNPEFICHRLNVDPSATPKKQPPRRPSSEHVDDEKGKKAIVYKTKEGRRKGDQKKKNYSKIIALGHVRGYSLHKLRL